MAGILDFGEKDGARAFIPLRGIEMVEHREGRKVSEDDRAFLSSPEGSVVYIRQMSGKTICKPFPTKEEGARYYEDLKKRIEKD